MLDNLKKTERSLGRELGRTWENLSESWHELLGHSNVLTRLVHNKDNEIAGRNKQVQFSRWSLLAGEIEETDKEVVVRVALPGMDKEGCFISIESNMLYVSGEKSYERENHDSNDYFMECAYGIFQRVIILPGNVDLGKAEAHYKNGVLTVNLPKVGGEKSRAIPV